eukprot:scaffold13297_cov184-Amphora_coffeaeformis.AAC.4
MMKVSSLLLSSAVVVVVVHAQDPVTLPLSAANVHWGFFSKTVEPVLTVASGTEVTVEMATHHAGDDYDRMIKGDTGMEDVYLWTPDEVKEEFRGATGSGDGVHILTGPIFVEGAEPGDVLKVEILDLKPRKNPDGKTYGSNAAAWWGFQSRVPKVDGADFTAGNFTATPDLNDEIVTIYEIMDEGDGAGYAMPLYQFEWPVITDPNGVTRNFIAYPGTLGTYDRYDANPRRGCVAKFETSSWAHILNNRPSFPPTSFQQSPTTITVARPFRVM